MKIVVIVSDWGAAANVGGEIERTVRAFDMPPEMAAYINVAKANPWANFSLCVEDTAQGDAAQGGGNG